MTRASSLSKCQQTSSKIQEPYRFSWIYDIQCHFYYTFRYVDYCRLEQSSDDIELVLTAIAKRVGALMKGNTLQKQKG